MNSPRFIVHRGAQILVLDYSEAGVAELPALLEQTERAVREQPPRSLLFLTRLRNTEFSGEANKLLLDHVTANGPFALASAVVGLGHLAGVIPIANRLTGRNIQSFDDETEALDWLASQRPPDVAGFEALVRFIERDGRGIIRIDFRRSSPVELMRRLGLAATLIRTQPPRSALTLTLVHGVTYDHETTSAIKEYVRGNRPYVLAGAVVGLDYLKQIILPLNRLTGRNLRAFDEEETAAAWHVAESIRVHRP